MSKLAFTTLLNRNDSILSPHFGKAKWIMMRDDAGTISFEQNTALNGRAVADILRRAECTDVISAEIGEGAFRHLQQAGIRSWLAPGDIPVPRLVEMFKRGELSPSSPGAHASGGCCHGAEEAGDASAGAHGHGRCCCG
jgi:predicted Fe-Mo cluster-binding NifX family protein